jgi:hypothetical protein
LAELDGPTSQINYALKGASDVHSGPHAPSPFASVSDIGAKVDFGRLINYQILAPAAPQMIDFSNFSSYDRHLGSIGVRRAIFRCIA